VNRYDRHILSSRRGAGLISFLSPCVLPLAPPYLCYLAGTSLEQLVEEGEAQARRDTMVVAVLFVLGFSTVFVALGATASVFGALIRQWSHFLSIAAGIGIILMGLHFLGALRIGAMFREKKAGDRQAAGPVERLSDGPGLRLRLDALHRADPGDHSGGSRLAGHRGARRRAAGRLFAGLGAPFVLAALRWGRSWPRRGGFAASSGASKSGRRPCSC